MRPANSEEDGFAPTTGAECCTVSDGSECVEPRPSRVRTRSEQGAQLKQYFAPMNAAWLNSMTLVACPGTNCQPMPSL